MLLSATAFLPRLSGLLEGTARCPSGCHQQSPQRPSARSQLRGLLSPVCWSDVPLRLRCRCLLRSSITASRNDKTSGSKSQLTSVFLMLPCAPWGRANCVFSWCLSRCSERGWPCDTTHSRAARRQLSRACRTVDVDALDLLATWSPSSELELPKDTCSERQDTQVARPVTGCACDSPGVASPL